MHSTYSLKLTSVVTHEILIWASVSYILMCLQSNECGITNFVMIVRKMEFRICCFNSVSISLWALCWPT